MLICAHDITNIIQQFNCVKEMAGLPAVAEAFQSAGITTLLYDPRNTGMSDGEPRNHIDPFQQIQDYSDALTFLSTLSNVNPREIGFWGTSLSASVALSAAAFDKRPKLVIAACPIAAYQYDEEKMQCILLTCFKDSESQIKGNPPFYVPMIDNNGESPIGLDFGYDRARAAEWAKRGVELAPSHVNRTTIQSYLKMAMWEPWVTWRHINPTPVLFLVPEMDKICSPEEQLRHFNNLEGPKRYHLQEGSGHMDLLESEHIDELMKIQIDFLHDALEGKVSLDH